MAITGVQLPSTIEACSKISELFLGLNSQDERNLARNRWADRRRNPRNTRCHAVETLASDLGFGFVLASSARVHHNLTPPGPSRHFSTNGTSVAAVQGVKGTFGRLSAAVSVRFWVATNNDPAAACCLFDSDAFDTFRELALQSSGVNSAAADRIPQLSLRLVQRRPVECALEAICLSLYYFPVRASITLATTNRVAFQALQRFGSLPERLRLQADGRSFLLAISELLQAKQEVGARISFQLVTLSRADPRDRAAFTLAQHFATVAARRRMEDAGLRSLPWIDFEYFAGLQHATQAVTSDVRRAVKSEIQRTLAMRWQDSGSQGALRSAGATLLWRTADKARIPGFAAFLLLLLTDSLHWHRGGSADTEWHNPCACGAQLTARHLADCKIAEPARAECRLQLLAALRDVPQARELEDKHPDLAGLTRAIFQLPHSANDNDQCRILFGLVSKQECQAAVSRLGVDDDTTKNFLLNQLPVTLACSAFAGWQQCNQD